MELHMYGCRLITFAQSTMTKPTLQTRKIRLCEVRAKPRTVQKTMEPDFQRKSGESNECPKLIKETVVIEAIAGSHFIVDNKQ